MMTNVLNASNHQESVLFSTPSNALSVLSLIRSVMFLFYSFFLSYFYSFSDSYLFFPFPCPFFLPMTQSDETASLRTNPMMEARVSCVNIFSRVNMWCLFTRPATSLVMVLVAVLTKNINPLLSSPLSPLSQLFGLLFLLLPSLSLFFFFCKKTSVGWLMSGIPFWYTLLIFLTTTITTTQKTATATI